MGIKNEFHALQFQNVYEIFSPSLRSRFLVSCKHALIGDKLCLWSEDQEFGIILFVGEISVQQVVWISQKC